MGAAQLLAASPSGSDGVSLQHALTTPAGLLICWLIAINLLTFLFFGIDKLKAKRKESHAATRRVPEKTLFLLAILGGSIGALLGMKVWHHKTLHRSFKIGIPIILILQILIPFGLWIYLSYFR